MTFVCLHCRERLRFDPARGWVHIDGSLYRRRRLMPAEVESFAVRWGRESGPMELEIDDHCALPVPVEGDEDP